MFHSWVEEGNIISIVNEVMKTILIFWRRDLNGKKRRIKNFFVLLEALFFVRLFLFCLLLFACDVFFLLEKFFLKKNWNCPDNLIYNTTSVPSYTLWKHQKISSFLLFSGGIKWKYWLFVVVNISFKINPSMANFPILYALKTQENQKFSEVTK